jgi:hypothetical protein
MSAPEAYVKDHEATLLSYATAEEANDFLLSFEPLLEVRIKNNIYKYDIKSILFLFKCVSD